MKSVRMIVDERGNVYADLVGYAGEECQAAEEELRRALAELGLLTHVEGLRCKSPAEIAAETVAGPPQGAFPPQIPLESRKVKLG